MDNNSFQFLMPNITLYGSGCLEKLNERIQLLGTKALIITSQTGIKLKYVDKLKKILNVNDISYEIFSDINREPTTVIVDKGLEIYKEGNCDFLIAIGGGSVIDTAKAIGIMATNSGLLRDYMGLNKIKSPLPPLLAIATTSGTGSEVTQFTIIDDVEINVKMLIGSPYLIPSIAVNDPLLTISVPSKVTAATGIDALTHAIESYISVKSQPFTDNLALSAIKRISKNLRKAWANGNDIEARNQMALASMEAGMAFNNSSVTLVHGMSRPIGAIFHISHGIANALLLPTCMEFAMSGAPEKFTKIAEAMGENIEGMPLQNASNAAVKAIKHLCRDIEIPSIIDLGVDENEFLEYIPKMAQDALNSGSPSNTPRNVSKENLMKLYKKIL